MTLRQELIGLLNKQGNLCQAYPYMLRMNILEFSLMQRFSLFLRKPPKVWVCRIDRGLKKPIEIFSSSADLGFCKWIIVCNPDTENPFLVLDLFEDIRSYTRHPFNEWLLQYMPRLIREELEEDYLDLLLVLDDMQSTVW